MGSYFNFKNFGEMPQQEGNGTKPISDFPLARQSSIYSLTFDEFQNTWGGPGKDFGSLNMDELLKNIWTAEETQATASSNGARQGGAPNGNLQLQRQGSLTLPRTLSQKTVDEVWRNLSRESNGGNDGSGDGGSHLHQRQPTLGEMTLEEFLARAGVVREDAQPMTRLNNNEFYSELPQPNNNTNGLTLGFQQLAQNNVVPNLSSGLPLNVGRSSQQQLRPPQPHPIFPKQAIMDFASPMPLTKNSQLASTGTRGAPIAREDPSINAGFVQGNVIRNGAVGMNGLGTGTTVVGAGSLVSKLSSYGIAKSNVDTPSISSSPYTFNGGVRGRKCGGTLEKATERRHRRMIKNRESAARSRARKQAYTLELEAEIAKLKEVNEELQRKQEEIVEMRKNQILATMKMPWGSKRLCLRRTLTGPW